MSYECTWRQEIGARRLIRKFAGDTKKLGDTNPNSGAENPGIQVPGTEFKDSGGTIGRLMVKFLS